MTRAFWPLILLLPGLAAAEGPAAPDDGGPSFTTRHTAQVGGQALRYTARAGRLPIRHNETGEVRAWMFYVSYQIEPSPQAPRRPVTFLWNGGPGANASLVHLSGFGPKTIRPDAAARDPYAEWKVEDNETTWLDQTDLVFVDPVGTGFSRVTRAEYGGDFYNTLGDIDAMAEFVRVYLTRTDAWDAPLLIGGESYGVWRAAGVAEALVQRGRKVVGVILISGGIPVGPVLPDEVRTALFLPTRTAAAFHHKKLAPDLLKDRAATLAQVEQWARTVYAPALARRDKLTDPERKDVVHQLARFTGLDASLIDPKTLIVGRQPFAEQLLKGDSKVLARYDTRLTAGEESHAQPGRQQAVGRYLRSTLGYQTDLAYLGTEQGFSPGTPGKPWSVGARWNYNQGPPQAQGTPVNADAPPGGHQPWLRRTMTLEPSLRAFVATGWYDSLNSCAFHEYLVSQLPDGMKANVTAKSYEGGHMMYESPAARQQLREDIRTFLQACTGRPDPQPRNAN